ncbi:MAG: hypothetical protein IJ605_03525 [Prevotella sp.]|nr:hypothetical protein [Prevotella sp.]
MKRILFFALILISAVAHANPSDSLLQFVSNIRNFNMNFPQEKVYLHLDNTGYFKDETLWFKAYVIRDDWQRASNLSGVLYVELVDPMGEVVQTHKLEIKEGQADGSMELKGLLNSGFYEVRAYTRYMVNWGNTGMFSRIIPVLNAPQQEGDWNDRTMDVFSFERRLPVNREKEDEANKKMNVGFYPESGHLIAGLENRVAFAVTNQDGAHFETSGWLEVNGQRVGNVETVREGRGIVAFTPGESRAVLHLKDEKGKERTFQLPKAEPDGCVLAANTQDDSSIQITLEASAAYAKQELGLIILQHGKVLDFRNLTIGNGKKELKIDKNTFGDGVNQLSLITPNGDVIADRMVFVYPRKNAEKIEIKTENQYLKSYGKITLTAHSRPNTSFSLAVRDFETQINGWDANAQSWLLLSSDLKGYIENANYYFEADDKEHRQSADLLMMVQGWRRYNLPKMMKANSFQLMQPREPQLMLDGRMYFPKKMAEEERKDIDLFITVVDQGRFSNAAQGQFKTYDEGRFTIPFSAFHGSRDVILRPETDGDISKFEYAINRWFSPPTRHIYRNETLPLPVDTPKISLGWKEDSAAIKMGRREYMLQMVEVKGERKNRDPKAWWYNENKALRTASIYYDCTTLNEQLRDKHQKSPDFIKWLKQKNSFFGGNWGNEYDDNKGGFTVTRKRVQQQDGIDYKRRPVIWFINNNFYCLSYAPPKLSEKDINLAYATWEGMTFPTSLNEVRSVYISEDPLAWQSRLLMPDLLPYRPVTVFIYKQHKSTGYEYLRKGIRSIVINGFDTPKTFESPNYTILPSLPDHRRTLYWNPNVQTDKEGHASIEFYNNQNCRQIVISAEGITPDGSPIVY